MSTRGAIVRRTGDDFSGRYHHFDSYPDGLGETLWRLYNTVFERDMERMQRTLIDEHPAGWSTIQDRDWSRSPGYGDSKAPNCYCHGDRAENEMLITSANAAGCGCEYVYLLETVNGQDMMTILSSYHSDGSKMIGMFGYGDPDSQWKPIAHIALAGPAPDWSTVESEESEEEEA